MVGPDLIFAREDAMKTRTQNFLFILFGLLIGLTVFVASSARAKRAQQDITQKKGSIASVPEIASCVSNIRVVKTEITNAESPDAYLTIEVENTSDVGITAIAIETAKGPGKYQVIRSGFGADKEPLIVIKPHGTNTLIMAVTNVYRGVPLLIGSVMYADGTEEGCGSSLKTVHQVKERELLKKKEATPQ
jgi:hypothetical protein